MKVMFSVFLLSMFYVCCFAQQEFQSDILNDVYGLEVYFMEKIASEKCDCCNGLDKKYKECLLFYVEIKSVFFLRDSVVYENEKSIKEVEYLVVPREMVKVSRLAGNTFIVFAHSSCSKKVLATNQLLSNNTSSLPDYTGMPYVSGLLECKKFNFFQRILIRLNINREKINSKGSILPPDTFKFIKIINSRS